MNAAASVRGHKKRETKVPEVACAAAARLLLIHVQSSASAKQTVLPRAQKEQGTVVRVPFGVITINHLGFSQGQSLSCVTGVWMGWLAGQYVGAQVSHGDWLYLGFHWQVLPHDRYVWGWRGRKVL